MHPGGRYQNYNASSSSFGQKLLQFTWRSDTGRFNLWVPDLQVSYIDLTWMRGLRPRFPVSASGAIPLQWRHNECDEISKHQPNDCLLNGLFRRRSKKISKLCVTGLCTGNSPVTGEFPALRASNTKKCSHLMTPSYISTEPRNRTRSSGHSIQF